MISYSVVASHYVEFQHMDPMQDKQKLTQVAHKEGAMHSLRVWLPSKAHTMSSIPEPHLSSGQ
jgi:hypothetical protein